MSLGREDASNRELRTAYWNANKLYLKPGLAFPGCAQIDINISQYPCGVVHNSTFTSSADIDIDIDS